ncbi:hypothetical protein JMJ55_25415 [Belnapia sp. T6]|uniref:Uncharacterized protein n=1 Tax=Belnapia mucosa TaxID=2804532 RepID=A0ABS1VAG5_9PROT|nr:hypothetical protein [Belnapia mucosa]MBL6458680.1 hypothetical protein [Belnapia mucosa]
MTKPVVQTIRALSVRVLPGKRRNPTAIVRVRVGPLTVSVAVALLRKSGLTARLPMDDDGRPAIEARPEVWTAIQKVAFEAVIHDPAASEHLFGPELRHLDRSVEGQLQEVGASLP